MIPPGARVDAWAPSHAPGIAPSSSDEAIANEKLPNTQVPGGRGADHRDRLHEVRADQRRRLERGVEHQQPDDHDRARPDRREARP